VANLRYLVERYYDVQKVRIISYNNLVAWIKQNIDEEDLPDTDKKFSWYANALIKDTISLPDPNMHDEVDDIIRYTKEFIRLEKELKLKIKKEVNRYSIYTEYLRYITGIDVILAGGLIAWIEPISRFDKPSDLVAYAGLSAEHWKLKCKVGHKIIATSKKDICPIMSKQGKICGKPIIEAKFYKSPPIRESGYTLAINTRLKTHVLKIIRSFEFMKPEKSFYKRLYLQTKQYYQNRPDLKNAKPIHIRRMTMRNVAMIFINHLWEKWRELEGLPIVKPYVFAVLGHRDYIPPQTDITT